MKCQIKVTGSISGNIALINAINPSNSTELPFNNHLINCDSLSEAQELLANAYDTLRSEEPDYSGLELTTGNKLKYDASVAEIIDEN
jgi:hypothetical protein